jgi:hypothetical protein
MSLSFWLNIRFNPTRANPPYTNDESKQNNTSVVSPYSTRITKSKEIPTYQTLSVKTLSTILKKSKSGNMGILSKRLQVSQGLLLITYEVQSLAIVIGVDFVCRYTVFCDNEERNIFHIQLENSKK